MAQASRQAGGRQGAAQQGRAGGGKTSARRAMAVMWVSIAVMVVVVLALPTVIILLFGMMPTLVAWIVDRSREKYATFCVLGMNLAGVFPSIVELWTENHTIAQAMRILSDVFDLVVMYGAAAFGWVVFILMPPLIASFLATIAQRRVNTLRAQQRKLIEEWGERVARDAEAEKPAGPAEGETPEGGEERQAA